MSAPDRITVARIVLAPIFFVLFFVDRVFQGAGLVSVVGVWIVFLLAELSDALDGLIARRLGKESERGKLLDPYADSVSRLTYFICFSAVSIMPVWALLLVVYRDLSVAFIRVLLSRNGVVLGARLSGKVKAFVYAVAGAAGIVLFSLRKLLILPEESPMLTILPNAVFGLCGLIAVWSLIDYAWSSCRRIRAEGIGPKNSQ